MAISDSTLTTSFKQALLDGEMDFSSDTSQTFKIALYTSSATLDASTTAYTASDEVANGDGYTTTGNTLTISTNPTNGGSGTVVYLSFANTTWSAASITARGALIYQSGGSNPSVAVINFGADKTSTSGDFTIQFPTADSSSAIIRIA
jgi:hypothetical protein